MMRLAESMRRDHAPDRPHLRGSGLPMPSNGVRCISRMSVLTRLRSCGPGIASTGSRPRRHRSSRAASRARFDKVVGHRLALPDLRHAAHHLIAQIRVLVDAQRLHERIVVVGVMTTTLSSGSALVTRRVSASSLTLRM